MRIRLATVDDGPLVAALRRAWTEENAGSAVDDDTFDDRFAGWWEREQAQRLTWLADVGEPGETDGSGGAVGMLNLLVFERMPFPLSPETARPTRWGYVANVFVQAGHREAGLGADLLTACTAYADEQHLARLVLSPSERSVPLYARFGFAPATSLMLRPGR